MARDILFGLVGGLGLFFLGMRTMSDALRKVASDSFKKTLEVVTRHPVLGLFIGTAITALVQSSSATTVMAVGFVNAGLLTLRQAISIILGANIGTTLTAWLVSFFAVFKITTYALPAIGVGYFLGLLGKTQKQRRWGQLLLGFGLLFSGLGFIKDAFGPLKDSPALRAVMVSFSSYPILGVLAGTLITVILQSSSATIALLQLLAFSGVIDFSAALPIILGDNIGTTITALLASIGTNTNARRAAVSHAALNILGVCYMIVFVYLGWYERLIDAFLPGPVSPGNIMVHIALAHTTFNVLNSFAVFLPLIGVLERIVTRLVRTRKGALEMAPVYLERHLLDTTSLAMQQAVKELLRMMGIASEALANAVRCLFHYDSQLADRTRQQEDAVDLLQKEITQYLVEISERSMDASEAEEIPVLIHSVNDVERIGDHAENIMELALRRQEQRLEFTDSADRELREIYELIRTMMQDVTAALSGNQEAAARRALAAETALNALRDRMKDNHVRRLQEQECNLLSGLIFMDYVDNMEKIGDHLTNIAEASLRGMRWDVELEPEGDGPAPQAAGPPQAAGESPGGTTPPA